MVTKTARGALLLLVVLRFSIPASADRPTNIAVNPAAGTYGGTTTLQATLTSTGRPAPNQIINFALNGTAVGSATTNSNGVATLANVTLAGIAASTYSKGVTATFAGTADLRSSQRTAALTVNQKPASVTPNPASKTFGAPDPNPLTTGTLTGFLASDTVTGASYVRTPGEAVGTYTISVSAVLCGPAPGAPCPAAVLSNYSITNNTAAFTILPSASLIPLTVKANDATKVQGQPNPAFTVTYTGFVDNDSPSSLGGTLTFTTAATTSSPVGTYAVTPGGLTSSKYAITFVSGTLNIVSAPLIPLTVKANDATKVQGQPNPAFTATYTGFVDNDSPSSLGGTLTFTTNATTNSPVGDYAVTPGGLTSSKYAITFVSGTLTILPSALIPLSVTANNATKLQGQPNPTFTATYNGFVGGDSPSSLGGTLTFSTNATTNSPVGAYGVTPGGLTSSKYSITFVSGTLSVVNAYVTDQNIYTPPDYLTFQPPAVGVGYTDTPGFYTPIKRLSDSMHTTDAGTGNPSVVMISTEYSTMSPFNQDNSKLILVHLSYFGLYDGAGNFIRNLPLQITASSEPRWSRSDPNVLYYVQGNQLKQYNVGTDATSVVHAFTEYSRISGKFKSDISFDGNHFVFVGDNRYVFVYEINTDSKGAVFDTGGVSFNNVGITPNGNITIAWIAGGSNRYQGIELFDSNMNFLRQIVRYDGHSDFTRDTNGDEVLVWTNSADPNPISNCNNGVVKIRLSDAAQTCLAKFDWSLAVHISGTDNSGWVFVETYAPGDPIPPAGWFKYTDELLQVKLDGSQVVRRLAHHRSRPLNSYSYQPKLSISRDGSKLAYASNFGLQQILGYPTEYSDTYTIDLSVISPDSLGTAYTGP